MTAKFFKCPDDETIEIDRCLADRGCRLHTRCASRPYLRMVGYDREWRGVTPSMAGSGPRNIALKKQHDYAISPDSRAFAALGVGVHGKLAIHSFTHDTLAEEELSDDKIKGIADLLEKDEYRDGEYILTDYKTWGSFKVAKAIGIVTEKTQEPIMENGQPVLLKSGKNKGKPKTKTVTTRLIDPTQVDLRSEEYQLNRYRILFESYGFKLSHMQIQAITRDGNTYIANQRGLDHAIYLFPINFLPNNDVLSYYDNLKKEVDQALTGSMRMCNEWETWEGRRCEKWCEVYSQCQELG